VPGTPPATVSPPSAPVDNARERARAAYTAGQDAYTAGRFAAAEEHFALADALLPAVQAKYWRAMSLDQLGNVPAALTAFERTLSSPDKDQLGADKLAHAEARRQALAATPAELVITTVPSGARVNVSGVDLSSPTPLSLRLAPGRHIVRVVLDGYQPQQLELNVSAGEKLTPTLTLVKATSGTGATGLAIPALGADAPPPAAERSRVPGYVTLAIAGASAVVGTIFGIQALQDKSDFDDNPTTSKADDVERNALIADMAFGVTLTLGITGIVLLVADDPVPAAAQVSALEPQRLRITPYVAPTGGGAAATLTF
jgi:PEGA domain-containing protein